MVLCPALLRRGSALCPAISSACAFFKLPFHHIKQTNKELDSHMFKGTFAAGQSCTETHRNKLMVTHIKADKCIMSHTHVLIGIVDTTLSDNFKDKFSYPYFIFPVSHIHTRCIHIEQIMKAPFKHENRCVTQQLLVTDYVFLSIQP